MKKEKMFDLLGQVDDKFIEEALRDCEPYDINRPVTVLPGKTKITPLKIIAPIAACLAVAVGAKIVISSRNKPAVNPADIITASSGVEQSNAASDTVSKTDAYDLDECKKMLIETLNIPNDKERIWQTNLIDINNDGSSELFLASGGIDDMPGVFVFANTDNGVKLIGSFDTEENQCNPQSILRYNRDKEDFWYYETVKQTDSESGKAHVGEWSIYKIKADDNGISSEQILSYGARLVNGDDIEDVNIVNGQNVSPEENHKAWEKFSKKGIDNETLKNSNMTLNDVYPPLDMSSVPRMTLDMLSKHEEMALARATLCSQKYGDYEVSVVGRYIAADEYGGSDILRIGAMDIVLSKNGSIINYSNNCPIGGSIGNETYIKPEELAETIKIEEIDGDGIISIKFNDDHGKNTIHFKIYHTGMVQF